MSASLAVVTAASGAYARTLWQMLRDAERRRLHRAHVFYAFDLGLPAERVRALKARFPWVRWRSLDFTALPAWAAVSARTYAWKPCVVAEAAADLGDTGLLLWLDSATLFHGSLEEPAARIEEQGVYTLAGQASLFERCAPEIWRAFGAAPEWLHKPERVAGVVGFDLRSADARALLVAWRAQVDAPELWLPVGPRHKPDQALLTLLLLQRAAATGRALSAEEVDISSRRPVRWCSTRNKVRDSLPTWADPVARAYRHVEKNIDRLLLRLRHFKAVRIDGWHRWPKERFRVFVASSDASSGAVCELRAPHGSYYADPFPARDATGRDWLFLEEFLYGRNRGRLAVAHLQNGRAAGTPRPLELHGMPEETHRSFPFVGRIGAEWFLLPETCASRTLDLFSCEEWPIRWRLRRRILVDVDAVDSVLFEHAERWWLITSLRHESGGGRSLAIYHTDAPWTGEWREHPVNARRLYLDAPQGTGRCAGAPVIGADGALFRPMQSSRRFYGEGMVWMRIEKLATTEFHERPATAAEVAALPGAGGLGDSHHVVGPPGLIVWDWRDRTGYWRPQRSAKWRSAIEFPR